MGCSSCGTGANGKPAGCKSNGGCSSGGCNRMNVYDWLSTIPLPDGKRPYGIVEVTFNRGSRKEYFKNSNQFNLQQGAWIAVEGVSGFDVGQVNLCGELVRFQLKKYAIDESSITKRILREATEEDLNQYYQQKQREQEVMTRSRAMAKQLKLDMKIGEVEIQADGKKATFFYTADGRIDFRDLIKLFASEFKVKVEMKQIGARQESAKVGGIGSCGRELCCSTWLTDFKSVNTTAARYQNLSINQTKLSGQCGRLKCCLNYELDTYMDALRQFPEKADHLETSKGRAVLQKRDIFKNLMWYAYGGSSKQYPLTIARVQEIMQQNRNGEKPEDLQPVELEVVVTRRTITSKEDVGFVNDVGQVSLRSLERASRKKQNKPSNSKGKSHPSGNVAPKQQAGNVGKNRSSHQRPNTTGGKPQGTPKNDKPRDPNRNPNRNRQSAPPKKDNQGDGNN